MSVGALLSTYPNLWTVFFSVFFLTTLSTGLAYQIALKRALLPAIRERDIHQVRKPRVGGVAMLLSAAVALLVIASTSGQTLLHFQGAYQLAGLLAGMAVILLTGLLDDIYEFPWYGQLLGQFLAAACLVVGGIGVPYIRVPFSHLLTFTPIVSGVFTILWTMLLINVMNFFDGLDGLAGSVALTASVILLLVSLRFGYTATATLAIVLAGITAGFLPWNWFPSKIFMGTVGSQLLGYLLAILAIISGGKLATAVLVLGIPVLDAIIVVLRRLSAHQSPFHADQRHLHHRLLKLGLPVPWVVILTNALAILFGSLAIHTQATNTKGILALVLLLCMLLFIVITYLLERRRGTA